MVGDGKEIIATKDQWLRDKSNFCVDNLSMYEGRNEKVSELFLPGTKVWDE